jgi:hypothetical protein
VIVTYNQENFIVIHSRVPLLITYPKLEIIVSDDALEIRPGRSFRKMGQTYQGPHKIVLNRTRIIWVLAEVLARRCIKPKAKLSSE